MMLMAWIESHQQLERHPKTHALMDLMGWDVDTTIGKLHRFWWWCLDYAPTGDLRGKNDAVLAGSVGLAASDGKRFVDSMVQSCWIDRDNGTLRVHDWSDYAGRYLRESKFKRHPDKLVELDKLYPGTEIGPPPAPEKRPRTVLGQSKVPDLTNHTKPKKPPNPPAGGGGEFSGLIPAALDVPAFLEAWSKWEAHRRESGHRLKPTTAAEQLAWLDSLGLERAVATIQHTLVKGWRGLREPDTPRSAKNGKASSSEEWKKRPYAPG